MKIAKIQWRNFNSYGNAMQTIEFPKEGMLYNLVGTNGNGKTTIAEVISFLLFGKVDGKTKSDLVNRINGRLWGKIWLQASGHSIEIERTLDPTGLFVLVDGQSIDTAGKANVQSYLEEELYEIPYSVFKNILVLSIDDFKSFMTMSTTDKKNIIDKLFGLSIINLMLVEARSEHRQIKELQKTMISDMNLLEESVSSLESKIDTHQKQSSEDRKNALKDIKTLLQKCAADKKKSEESLLLLQNKRKDLQQKSSTISSSRGTTLAEIRSIESKKSIFQTGKCPHCESDLSSDHHAKISLDLDEAETKKREALQEIETEYQSLTKSIQTSDTLIRTSQLNLMDIEKRMQGLMLDANKFLAEEKTDLASLNSVLNETREKKESRSRKLQSLDADDQFMNLIEQILGEDGVKKIASKTITPSLNQSVSQLCKRLHVPYEIKFDDRFECVVTSLGQNISPATMSKGERTKADIAIIISLLKVLKLRYSSLNLMFIDEIFASVDPAGVYEVSKLLRELSKENNMSIWTMHHSELPIQFFDKSVVVTKDGGFSKVQLEAV